MIEEDCCCGRPRCASYYGYLAPSRHTWRRQLAFKNRRLTVGGLLGRMRVEGWTAEEAASQFDLPAEAVLEAVEYGERHAVLISAETAEDARAARCTEADLSVAADEQIDDAIARGRTGAIPRVVRAFYDDATDEVAILFESGVRTTFPRRLLQGLDDASGDQLREIEIAGPGTGLYWPQLHVGHYVRGLMDGAFGTRRWMQVLGAAGGATKHL